MEFCDERHRRRSFHCNRHLEHVNGGSLPLAVVAGGFLAACILTGIAWDLPPGATAQEAGEKLGLGHLL